MYAPDVCPATLSEIERLVEGSRFPVFSYCLLWVLRLFEPWSNSFTGEYAGVIWDPD